LTPLKSAHRFVPQLQATFPTPHANKIIRNVLLIVATYVQKVILGRFDNRRLSLSLGFQTTGRTPASIHRLLKHNPFSY
jgi:hypothetical protein